MPNASWPAELPQDVLRKGYEEAFPDVTVRTEMDVGPAKVRRRYTAGVSPFSAPILMTRAQVAVLKIFHVTTLLGGSLPFDFEHPRELVTVTFRFLSPPRIMALRGDWWQATLDLEILP